MWNEKDSKRHNPAHKDANAVVFIENVPRPCLDNEQKRTKASSSVASSSFCVVDETNMPKKIRQVTDEENSSWVEISSGTFPSIHASLAPRDDEASGGKCSSNISEFELLSITNCFSGQDESNKHFTVGNANPSLDNDAKMAEQLPKEENEAFGVGVNIDKHFSRDVPQQAQQLLSSPSLALARVDTAAEHQEKERELGRERKHKEEQEGKKDSEQVEQHVSSSPNKATVANKTEVEQATVQDDVTACSGILASDSLTASAAKNSRLQQRKRSCDSASSGTSTVNMNAKKSKLSCPICYQEINIPHTLHSCGHTACNGCLRQWFETSEKTGTLLPSCPICRTDVDQEDATCVMGRPFQPVGSSSSSSTSDGGLDELTEHWLAESSAKRCRNCQSWIIKEDGCNLMECLCGYRFCWECGIPGGRACGCSPPNHCYWDNINGENANETSSVATSNRLSNFRAFLLHRRRCNSLATQCANDLRDLLEPHKLKTTCKDILQSLLSHEHGWLFSEPVDQVAPQIPDYYQCVTRPMDLGFVRFYIDNGYYSSISWFRRDVHLTFDNAMLYNGQGSKIHAIAEELKMKFDDDLQNYVQKDLSDVASYGGSLNRCFADDERKYIEFLELLEKHRGGEGTGGGVMKIEDIEEEVTKLLQADPDLQKKIMDVLWKSEQVKRGFQGLSR